jgi:hypothetical protein
MNFRVRPREFDYRSYKVTHRSRNRYFAAMRKWRAKGNTAVHYPFSQWQTFPFSSGHVPSFVGPGQPQSVHCLADARVPGMLVLKPAVSARARLPMHIEYKIPFMSPLIFICELDSLARRLSFILLRWKRHCKSNTPVTFCWDTSMLRNAP